MAVEEFGLVEEMAMFGPQVGVVGVRVRKALDRRGLWTK